MLHIKEKISILIVLALLVTAAYGVLTATAKNTDDETTTTVNQTAMVS